MQQSEIDQFQRTLTQLEAFHREFEGLTKKAANSPLNSFKLRIVNQTLADANLILGDPFAPIRGFTQFTDEEMPSNSDASMVLAQYLESMEVLRCRNIEADTIGRWHWKVDGGRDIPTASPRRGMTLE